MKRHLTLTPFVLSLALLGCSSKPAAVAAPTPAFSSVHVGVPHVDGPGDHVMAPLSRPDLIRAQEKKHFKSLTQLTFGGENAEAYWSFDGKSLTLQGRGGNVACDQIYVLELGSGAMRRVSTGTGRTTCAHWLPGDKSLVFASTHQAGPECPADPDFSRGYVWPIYETFDIFGVAADGSGLKPLIAGDGYDAEATVCRDGSIVFTSTRDGDLELYRSDAQGGNVKRLTKTPGYDGGGFFSQDCSQIVWRASRFEGKALVEYQALLKEGLVRPSKLEVYVMDADGSNPRQVTKLGGAAFAPYFFPSGKRIVFASNHEDPKGRNFDLFAINVDGSDLEQITFEESFDSFAMFSPDGKHLVFSSNRGAAKQGETNVFLVEWQP